MYLKAKFQLLVVLFFLISSVFSQGSNQSLDEENEGKIHYEKLQKMSFEEYKSYFNSLHPRIPAEISDKIKEMKKTQSPIPMRLPQKDKTLKPRGSSVLPADARFPGEFEEVKGILISWPYSNLAGTLIDTIRNKPTADIWKNIARGVQEGGATIYINVYTAKDTGAVLKFMIDKGYPLTNYKFFIRKGNAFWVRDYGPVPFYYDNDEKQGWVDYKYYPGRGLDDNMNAFWSPLIGNYPVYKCNLYYEGGNIIVDGTDKNQLLTSEMVVDNNTLYFQNWTRDRVEDTLKNMFNSQDIHIKPYFEYEGGTGHIDLYLQRADDHTIVHTKMPPEMQNIPIRDGSDTTWLDFQIATDNINYFSQMNSPTVGKKNIIKTIPLPKRDDGSWYSSGIDYNDYTRTFSNSLVVNNVIVFPTFHNEVNGDKAWDEAATAQLQKHFPGYSIIAADMRVLDGSGGSIHCVTKEVPADNPIAFNYHYPYYGLQNYQAKYPVIAKIKNYSGIEKATVYYRKKGAANWKSDLMKDSTNSFYKGNIIPSAKGLDTMEYYLEASSNNGKTMRKPISAPEGYYTFFTKINRSYNSIQTSANLSFTIAPNPSQDYMTMTSSSHFNLSTIRIFDIAGKICQTEKMKIGDSPLDVRSLLPGIYFLEVVFEENGQRDLVKFVKE